MKNLLMMSATLIAGIAIGISVDSSAERKEAVVTSLDTPIQFETKLAKQADLKISKGTIENHTEPEAVAKRALTAAKEDKLADLKSCFAQGDHKNLDKEAWNSSEKMTNLQVLSKTLAGFDIESLSIVKQNTQGNFVVAMVESDKGQHVLQVHLRGHEDGFGNKDKPKGWFLRAPWNADELLINYADKKLEKFREAVKAGDTAAIKEFTNEYSFETQLLNLISGVKEGVDPYDLLIGRMQRIMKTAEKPYALFQKDGTSIAFWFEGEKESAFLVVNFSYQRDWGSKELKTNLQMNVSLMSNFHSNPGQAFQGFVRDYE
ncbi:MAG: hypothetical protein ACYTDT_07365 [Planctomycetota bacterium]|jgi:hypothetical protein